MSGVPHLRGAAKSVALNEAYTAYYASIADVERISPDTVQHRLRPGVGTGTIEVTSLRSGFEIVRYDLAFDGGHRIGFTFPADNFEIEYCAGGRVRVSEAGGHGHLEAGSVAVSPRYATDGVVEHGDGERYRAVSVTGSWTGLESYLGGLGVAGIPPVGTETVARERYLAGSAALLPAAVPLAEIFTHRRPSPGRLPFLESRVLAALSAMIDGLTAAAPPAAGRDLPLEPHEMAALRRVPDLLWHGRHALPTVAELARESSMSVHRLTAGFRALYGTSVMEFHRRRCLDHAAALLVDTRWSLARIGHEVGYASPGNFGYAFRRARGVTPARFRRAHS